MHEHRAQRPERHIGPVAELRPVAGAGIMRAQRLGQRRRRHGELACQSVERCARVENTRAVAPVVVDIGVSDAGRGRDEMRPAGKKRRHAFVEQDIADLVGLIRQGIGRAVEFVDKALPKLVDQDRALGEQIGRWRQRRGDEAHHERAQQRTRHVFERPCHQVRQQPPWRQAQQNVALLRRHEAQFRPEREIAVDDARAERQRQLLPIAGRGHIDAVDLGLLRPHELRLELRIAGEIAGRQHDAAARAKAPRSVRRLAVDRHHAAMLDDQRGRANAAQDRHAGAPRCLGEICDERK